MSPPIIALDHTQDPLADPKNRGAACFSASARSRAERRPLKFVRQFYEPEARRRRSGYRSSEIARISGNPVEDVRRALMLSRAAGLVELRGGAYGCWHWVGGEV